MIVVKNDDISERYLAKILQKVRKNGRLYKKTSKNDLNSKK